MPTKLISPTKQYRGRKEIAKRLKKSPRSVSLYMRKGFLKPLKVDGTTLIFTESAARACLEAVEQSQFKEINRRSKYRKKRNESGEASKIASKRWNEETEAVPA